MLTEQAFARAAMLEESEPQAQALGYHADGTKTDRARFPNYTSGDKCGDCKLFETIAGEKFGGCKAFPDRLVAATGWCSAYEIAI